MDQQRLEQRIQALEDIEAVRNLKADYCAYCDNNYQADALAALFTEDAVWDGGSFGLYNGREEIRKFFAGVSGLLSFAMHYVMNPKIEVNGDRATGRWYLFEPCTYAKQGQAAWGSAYYNDEYVKVDGKWKFKKVKLTVAFWTPYEQGWAKKRLISD